jgi:antitoxin HicB
MTDNILFPHYTIRVSPVPEAEGGGYEASIPQLGRGVLGHGMTPEEATRDLWEALPVFLKLLKETAQEIPHPVSIRSWEEFSGKFNVRVPKRLHWNLVRQADAQGVSMNSWLQTLLEGGVTRAEADVNSSAAVSVFAPQAMEDKISVDRTVLLTHPSVHNWHAELVRIMSGHRQSDIEQVGSASAYVEPYLRPSGQDIGASLTYFMEAIKVFFKHWSFRQTDPLHIFNNALDLLTDYDATLCASPILERMRMWKRFGPIRLEDGVTATDQDPHIKALKLLNKALEFGESALEFRPRLPRDGYHRHFVNILRDHFKEDVLAPYRGYVAGLMVHVGALSPDCNLEVVFQDPAIPDRWKEYLKYELGQAQESLENAAVFNLAVLHQGSEIEIVLGNNDIMMSDILGSITEVSAWEEGTGQ